MAKVLAEFFLSNLVTLHFQSRTYADQLGIY